MVIIKFLFPSLTFYVDEGDWYSLGENNNDCNLNKIWDAGI